MRQPKVSVIMAVYNAAPYLHRCLNSLLAQTLKDFDVIIVNDGSTDNSLEICNEYARNDQRFRVYTKENGGVSSARQFGIEQLAIYGGIYSIHLDPDDWVEPFMLEHLYQKAGETQAEMVICDYYVNYRNREEYVSQKLVKTEIKKVLGALFLGLHGSLWNKLILSSCYKDYNIRFPKGLNCFEDFVTVINLLIHIKKVVYLPEAFYHYDQYTSNISITRSIQTLCNKNNYSVEVVKKCREIVPDNLKNWQYYIFEAYRAFIIMRDSDIEEKKIISFFRGMPLSTLIHYHTRYEQCFWAILVTHGIIRKEKALNYHRLYIKLRHSISRVVKKIS